MSRSQMPKQMLPKAPKKSASKAPKNTGGMKLPAAIGKPKTNHGKMNFNQGGMVRKKYC